MYIDFHTHIFPDRIAARAVAKLEGVSGARACTDGTLGGLKASMEKNGIGLSVILPVVTKPEQFDSVQQFAQKVTEEEKGILSFGGVHPLSPRWREEIGRIADSGLKGMKIHPDYQDVYVDDIRLIRCVDYAMERGLTVVLHAGVDIGYPDMLRCTPQRAARLLEAVDCQAGSLVFAHIGGHGLWDDVERYLVGRPVYLDTAHSLDQISREQLLRIIRSHSAERILWATDSPWADQGVFKDYLEGLPLTERQRALISHENALRLLSGVKAEKVLEYKEAQ